MATYELNNSPVHSDSIITAIYGETGSSWATCGFHTGTDFAPYGDTPSNPDLYSVSSGEVVEVHLSTSGALGCYVVIRANNGNYFRYCHMLENSIEVEEGDLVTTNTKIGRMGETGSGAHGIHLHLEYATTQGWNCNTFLDPATYFGVNFARGDIVEYGGPGPMPSKNKANKWLKARAKRINIRL